jgi:putative signal transducing protein
MDAERPVDAWGYETGGVASGTSRLLVRTWSDGEALLVRQLLQSYGIPCQVVSDVPHTVLPLSVDGLGEIRILVPEARAEEARRVLADHLRNGLELVDGGRADVNEPRSEP